MAVLHKSHRWLLSQGFGIAIEIIAIESLVQQGSAVDCIWPGLLSVRLNDYYMTLDTIT